jgi:tricorn protease
MTHITSFRSFALALTLGMSTLATAHAQGVQPHAGMLRYPDVSKTHIVFLYANDLWVVPKEGGTALPLTSPPGIESLPKFAPDGKSIVFASNYDGQPKGAFPRA